MDLSDLTKHRIQDQKFEQYCEYVHYDGQLSQIVRELTKIKSKDVATAQQFHLVLEDFSGWLNTIREKRPDTILHFVTYNGMNYDMLLLAHEMARRSLNVEGWFSWIHLKSHIDVFQMMSAGWSLEIFKQTEAFRCAFGFDFESAHTAAADAQATLMLFLKYKKDFRHSCLDIRQTLFNIARDSGLPLKKIYDPRTRAFRTPQAHSFRSFRYALNIWSAVPLNTEREPEPEPDPDPELDDLDDTPCASDQEDAEDSGLEEQQQQQDEEKGSDLDIEFDVALETDI
jgi:inhibitor of KinA sporulation pathway (predicted exonuclease)